MERLVSLAAAAAHRAWAPYSGFAVGAALRAGGEEFLGCNVENASYGLTVCAERVAAWQAVAAGKHDFQALAVYTPGEEPGMPCGACLQVLAEFAPDSLPIRAACAGGKVVDTTLGALLTAPFRLRQGGESNGS